ncbi:beta carbonic anhydrase 5, chloroplastic isoform X2 [Hevea brasiliensis]|uniref:beta carbonic anhydrase 5, chloroplastic isoform X2 n=1 Tax=Hevea brasiliensis TaxID=3981 RepID=UPI0025F3CD31|nr:beta carbonic anhydrase 5, chloroplastic isoform X2 [Hevea brasiliensis]
MRSLKLKASMETPGLTREPKSDKLESPVVTKNGSKLFDEMKLRFLSFKKHKYMENLEHFENLAKGQAPKFMVIACADSRVCPSSILGFQPGEAFVVRNVANMVPSYESGPSETNAALEFAVNSLKVENILVIGHSCCGGIRALMSMHDDVETSSFIGSWVVVGMNARLRTKAAASNLSFDRQCRHCEKESVNCSLGNLLTYPWIEEKVRNGELSIHGGYYDFVDCTFEKWTLDYNASNWKEEGGKVATKNRTFWC